MMKFPSLFFQYAPAWKLSVHRSAYTCKTNTNFLASSPIWVRVWPQLTLFIASTPLYSKAARR